MIACVEGTEKLHIVRWVGRVRLSVKVMTYCGEDFDGGDGTVQVPDRFMDGPSSATVAPARELKPCEACKAAAK